MVHLSTHGAKRIGGYGYTTVATHRASSAAGRSSRRIFTSTAASTNGRRGSTQRSRILGRWALNAFRLGNSGIASTVGALKGGVVDGAVAQRPQTLSLSLTHLRAIHTIRISRYRERRVLALRARRAYTRSGSAVLASPTSSTHSHAVRTTHSRIQTGRASHTLTDRSRTSASTIVSLNGIS